MAQDKIKGCGLVNTIMNPGVVLKNREFIASDKLLSLFLRKIALHSFSAKMLYHEVNLIFLYISDARLFYYKVQIKRKKIFAGHLHRFTYVSLNFWSRN